MGKYKMITIVGARPQFIKASAISRCIKNNYSERIHEVIVNSGQHYDDLMSKVFFEELNIPEPDYDLGVGSGSHAYQTGEMLQRIENILIEEKPGMVIVYGDTNTTLAGALAAVKLHIPVAHIEAGLRSYNKSMPEEINRICCDHMSTFLFSPTLTGYMNLVLEGFNPNTKPAYSADNPALFHCGDIMLDNALYFQEIAEEKSNILQKLNIAAKDFILCTIHRENNTDDSFRLNNIIQSLDSISRERQVEFIIPLHPRTAKAMPRMIDRPVMDSLAKNPYMKLIPPLSYFDMVVLEKHCRLIITDSGGVQKESYFFRKPCIVLRTESEWKELVEMGHAVLADASPEKIRESFHQLMDNPPQDYPSLFGDGKASAFILHELVNFLEGSLQV